MKQRIITQEEVSRQAIYSTSFWTVLLPERPVSSYHFLVIPNRNDAAQFTDLSEAELLDMKSIILFLTESIENHVTLLNGYNLFSNNGSYEIGQHLSRFHQHIFIRVQNELESPYDIMASGRRWFEIGSVEWIHRLAELRDLFALARSNTED